MLFFSIYYQTENLDPKVPLFLKVIICNYSLCYSCTSILDWIRPYGLKYLIEQYIVAMLCRVFSWYGCDMDIAHLNKK